MVITKDLSRLGRDMRESSYYAEQFFPEHQIHYIAIADNFDSELENVMAPFQFAMNEVYLRDSSRKARDVFKMKRSKAPFSLTSLLNILQMPPGGDVQIISRGLLPVLYDFGLSSL